ncbi:MAG: hypothetical protein ACRBFS_08885 [Aureispira sp.]
MLIRLLINGGLFFTGPIALLAIAVWILAIHCRVTIKTNERVVQQIKLFHGLGLLAFILGILGQLLGLAEGLSSITSAGGVSSEILIEGLKISSIPTVLGFITFTSAKLASIYLTRLYNKLPTANS